MKASDVIQGALDRLTDPEKWWKGEQGPVGNGCALTAMSGFVCHHADGHIPKVDFDALRGAVGFVCEEIEGNDIPRWNDDPHVSFEDMRLSLKLAKERALEAGE